MIQSLRTAHRRSFMAMAMVLPLLLAAAVVSRKPIPAPAFAHQTWTSGQRIGEFRFLLNGQRASISLIRLAGNSRDRCVLHAESGEIPLPETLLYWSPFETTDAVPAGATLIGPITILSPLAIPEKYTSSGSLLLYDAPHKLVLAHLPVGNR